MTAAALRKEVEVVGFLKVPVLAECEDDPGLSLVVVGLLRLERDVVGLSTPDLWEETVAVDGLLAMIGPVARDDKGRFRSFLSVDAVDRDEAVVCRLGLSVPLVDVDSEGAMDILFGFAEMPASSRFDSFSVFSALLSTDCLLLLVTDVVPERGAALVGFRALAVDANVGLVGGLLKVEGVVLLAEAAVDRVAFVEAAVGLLRVEGFVVRVEVDLVEVVSGLFTVLDVLERPLLIVGSAPKALCGREEERSMSYVLLLFNVELNFLYYTKFHHSNVQLGKTESKEQRSQVRDS